MGEYTQNLPKPLLPFGNETLLDHSIDLLEALGISKIVINTHYFSEKIEAHIQETYGTRYEIEVLDSISGKVLLSSKLQKHSFLSKLQTFLSRKLMNRIFAKKNVSPKIFLCRETPNILGTGGGIKTALEATSLNPNTILVINPDSYFPTKHANSLQKQMLSSLDSISDWDFFLFLKEKKAEDSFTGFSIDPSKGKIHFEKTGKYYYIGISICKFSEIEKIESGKESDLADSFRNSDQNNRLSGTILEAPILDVGEKHSYEAHKKFPPT